MSEEAVFLGIDPGKKGGIAAYGSAGYEAHKMPETTGQVLSLLIKLTSIHSNVFCTIEQVQVMGKSFGAKAALSYGQGYGEIIGILTALGVRINEVRPSVWKKKLAITSDKNTAILLCERLYPSLDLTPGRCQKPQDGLAEAMLLCHYGMKFGGA